MENVLNAIAMLITMFLNTCLGFAIAVAYCNEDGSARVLTILALLLLVSINVAWYLLYMSSRD